MKISDQVQENLFRKRYLYIALSAVWLTACSGGGTSSSNTANNSAAAYTLNKYISQLRYVPLSQSTKQIAGLSDESSSQQAFFSSESISLNTIAITFYNESNCQESKIFINTLYP